MRIEDLAQSLKHRPSRQCRFLQCEDGDVRSRYPIAEIGVVLGAQHQMPISIGRNAVDEVDEAIFHAADHQVMNDVRYERRLRRLQLIPQMRQRNARSENPQFTPQRSTLNLSIGPRLNPP